MTAPSFQPWITLGHVLFLVFVLVVVFNVFPEFLKQARKNESWHICQEITKQDMFSVPNLFQMKK